MDTSILILISIGVAIVLIALIGSRRTKQPANLSGGRKSTARSISLASPPERAHAPKRTRRSTGNSLGRQDSGVPFHWPSLDEFEFQVVGESHYQTTIAGLEGVHGTENADVECIAELVPENDNPHDPSAVSVRINGEIVGYLSRNDARSFRRRLGQKGMSGQTTNCDARIVGGGTRRNGEKLFYGVVLDIKPFD